MTASASAPATDALLKFDLSGVAVADGLTAELEVASDGMTVVLKVASPSTWPQTWNAGRGASRDLARACPHVYAKGSASPDAPDEEWVAYKVVVGEDGKTVTIPADVPARFFRVCIGY